MKPIWEGNGKNKHKFVGNAGVKRGRSTRKKYAVFGILLSQCRRSGPMR
jgi:hypothetical protein